MAESSEKIKISANEIVVQYLEGKRDFSNIVLRAGNLEGTSLVGVNFSNSDLSFTSFARSNLAETEFANCNLQRVNFEGATIFRAKFDGSDMQWAILKGCFFEKTSLRKCKLSWAHLCKDDLAKADLRGADLSMVCIIDSNITSDQLQQMPEETRWTLRVKGDEKETDSPIATRKGLSYVDSSKGQEYGGRQQGVDVYKKSSPSGSAVYGLGGTTDEAVYNTSKTVSNDPHDAVGSMENEYVQKKQEEIRRQQEEMKRSEFQLMHKKMLK